MPVNMGFTPTVAELEKRDRIAVAISQEQAATEQHLHEQIDRRDANVLGDYAEYFADHLSEDLLRNLGFAMLMTDDRVWHALLQRIRPESRLLYAALDDLAHDLERLRAGFMAFKATAILQELKP